MSNIEKTKQTAIERYSDIAKNLEFCDDFGDTPVFMAHFTRDRSLIGVLSILGGFIAMAGLGIPGALFVGFAALNDLTYTGKDGNEKRMGEDREIKLDEQIVTKVEDEAIEVKSETVLDSQNVIEAAKPSMGVSKIMSPLDILIRARFSHRAFYGGQRCGKSYLAAIASQALSLTGIKVFHMNLFSHGPEDKRYWVHAARSVQCDLSSLSPDEAVPFIRQAQSILSEFKVTSDALLIIDEITSMGNLRSEHLENLQPFINGLVSYINAIRDSSKKRHKAVWTIGPGIVSAGLDQGVKELIKGLSPVLVSIPKDVSIMWEDQTLTTDLTVYGQLKINYQGISEPPVMDCDRMVLLDNIWMPMGDLPPLPQVAPPPSDEDDGGSCWIDPGNGKWTAITSEGEGTGDSISAASDDLENRLNLEKSWGIDATEIDVETRSIIDRPEGLDDFPLVATVWDYLNTKDPRSLKQISDSMRAKGKIPEDVLRTKIGGFETYKDAIKTVVTFGVSKGYLRQVSEDTYEAIQEH